MRLVEEPEFVDADLEDLRQLLYALVGGDGGGQHHQVGLDLHLAVGQGVSPPDHQLVAPLEDFGDPAPEVDGAVLFLASLHEFFVALAAGADVHVEHVGLAVVHGVLVEHGVLGGVHAADPGAVRVGVFRVTGSDTGDEYDLLGDLAVAGPPHLTFGGTGSRQQTLELQPVDHVRVFSVPVLGHIRHRVEPEAGSHQDTAYLHLDSLGLHIKIDSPRLAYRGAQTALFLGLHQTVLFVDGVNGRYRLRRRYVNGFPFGQPFVEFAFHFDRALGGAVAAGSTLVRHEAGLLLDSHLEVAHGAFDVLYLAVCQQPDVWVLGNLHHLRGENTL